jgi:hypothetical protein
MARGSPFQIRLVPCLLLFTLSLRYGDVANSQPKSLVLQPVPVYSSGSGLVFPDLDGDHEPDLAGCLLLGRSKDGYFYQVQVRLSGEASADSFTVVHNSALGLKITGLDIDVDHDIDLIISDRFFGQRIGLWLNDGKGRFLKSPRDAFTSISDSGAAFVAVDNNYVRQRAEVRDRHRFSDYVLATRYIQPLPLKSSKLSRHPVEWTAHFAIEPLQQRPPPTISRLVLA